MKNTDTTLQALHQAIERNNEVMGDVLAHLRRSSSPWCNPDEAAELLGLPLTESRSHRRKVSWLAKQGFIPRFQAGRPYRYWKADVVALAPRLATGEVVLPTSV